MRLSVLAFTARVAAASCYLTLVAAARDVANELALPYAAAVAGVAAYDYYHMKRGSR